MSEQNIEDEGYFPQDEIEIGKYQERPKIIRSITLQVVARLLETYDCGIEIGGEEEEMPPFLRVQTLGGLQFSAHVLDEGEFVLSPYDEGDELVMGATFDVVGEGLSADQLHTVVNRWNRTHNHGTATLNEGLVAIDFVIVGEGLLSTKFVEMIEGWFTIVSDFVNFVKKEALDEIS
ncbi:YbjN domain-containing protein [Salipiger sp. PrR003]|uniref:YbjN domain-containing protein n=1 Tax=Salipiger sp. PrR003 TaxID=2706776 RepID=UPI0013DAB154|nr:YbjN domain-containing protein [Salipiger sp. PrR003]NDV50834.1 hypothetical protein [Salipiger sp. PrR003]